MHRLLATVLVAALLSGCSSAPSGEPQPTPSASVITDPADFANATDGSHVHDYWRGGDRLTVVDQTHPGGEAVGTGPGFAQGQDIEVRSFQPAAGSVVPQGTSAVEVTFSWTDAALDSYTAPALWLKTAGTNATERVADVENGVTLTIEAGAPDADLPHQVLSAWLFELRMDSPDPMPLRFKGAVTLKVDAVRGLPLPVFPPHPDPWRGATELPLLTFAGSLSYFEDLIDQGCNGAGCPEVLRPESGRLVPHNATAVKVELTWSSQAFTPQVLYHGAASRDFMVATTPAPSNGVYSFDLPVDGGGGDGPYATQSQWEFKVVPQPVGALRTAWAADYTVDAKVIR